jgi:NADH:ubiquinone oxidoreductase subunit 6 (subunit J)
MKWNSTGAGRSHQSHKQRALKSLTTLIGIVFFALLFVMAWQQPVATASFAGSYAAAPMAAAPETGKSLNMMSDYLFILALPIALFVFGSQIHLLKQISSRVGRKPY